MTEVVHRTLRADERAGFLALMEAAFRETFMFGRYLDHDPKLAVDDTLVAVDGDRIVSAVQIFTRRIRLAGTEIPLGGIGSVATHPEYERRGHASELLRRAIAEMQRRGMALSLLFTGRVSFYERLGWVLVPHRQLVVHRGRAADEAGIAPFAADDLSAVRALYEAYGARLDGSARRDDAYWRGQLVFAGNPDEDFRVLRQDGRIVAYARRIEFEGLARIMEMGREPGAGQALARLLLALTPADRPIFLPETADAELEAALRAAAGRVDVVEFPEQMWRVLDAPALRSLAGDDAPEGDADLLRRLVAGPGVVYWFSDRF